MKKVKKQPMRSCVVCREKFIKRDLLRIVRNQEGEIFVDPSGKAAGRGAYICSNPKCIESFLKRPNLERIFKHKVDPEQAEKVRLSIERWALEHQSVEDQISEMEKPMN